MGENMGNTAKLRKSDKNNQNQGRGTKGLNFLRLNFGRTNGQENLKEDINRLIVKNK
jgi:hypothetical protein